MMARYQILPSADRDLDAQADYLAREGGIEVALRFYEAASASFEFLAQTPGIGETRATSNPQLDGLRGSRIKGFKNHIIFSRPIKNGIQIVRVLHGARDVDHVIGGECDE